MSVTSSGCLQLTKFYPPVNGGIETTVQDIAEGLTRQDRSVEILCAHTECDTVREIGIIPVTRVASWGKVAVHLLLALVGFGISTVFNFMP